MTHGTHSLIHCERMSADGEDGVGGITTLKDEATDTLIYAPPPQGNFTLHHQPAVRSAFSSYLFFSEVLGRRLELTIVSCAQVDVLLDLLRTHEPGEITILTIGMKPFE